MIRETYVEQKTNSSLQGWERTESSNPPNSFTEDMKYNGRQMRRESLPVIFMTSHLHSHDVE